MEERKKFNLNSHLLPFSEMKTNNGQVSIEKQCESLSSNTDCKNDVIKAVQNDDSLSLPSSYCWSFNRRKSPICSHETYTINQKNKNDEIEEETNECLFVNMNDPKENFSDNRNSSFNNQYPPGYFLSNVERKCPFKDYINATEIQFQKGLFSNKREKLSAVDDPSFLMKEKDRYSEIISDDLIERNKRSQYAEDAQEKFNNKYRMLCLLQHQPNETRMLPSDIKHDKIRQYGEHNEMKKILFNYSNLPEESKSIQEMYGNRLESTLQSKDTKHGKNTSQNKEKLSGFWWLKKKDECDDNNSNHEPMLKFKMPFLCSEKKSIEAKINVNKLKSHDKYNEVFNQPCSTHCFDNQQNPESKPIENHLAHENELFKINDFQYFGNSEKVKPFWESCNNKADKWWKNVKRVNLPDTPYGLRGNNFENLVKQVLGNMHKNDIMVKKNDPNEVEMGCDLKRNDILPTYLDKEHNRLNNPNFKSNAEVQRFIEDNKKNSFEEIESRTLLPLPTFKVDVKNEIVLSNKRSCELEPDLIQHEKINEITADDSFSNKFNHTLEYTNVIEENNQEKIDETSVFGLIHDKQNNIISRSSKETTENKVADFKFNSNNTHDDVLKRIKPLINEGKANKEVCKLVGIIKKEQVAKANEIKEKERIINVEKEIKAEVVLMEENNDLLFENSLEKGEILTTAEDENNVKYDAVIRNTENKILCYKYNQMNDAYNKQEKNMSMIINVVNNPVVMVGKTEEFDLELFKVKELNNQVCQLNEVEVCLRQKVVSVEDNGKNSVEKYINKIKEQEKTVESKIFRKENMKTDDGHASECCKSVVNNGVKSLTTAEIREQHNENTMESATILSKENLKEDDEDKCTHHIDDIINKELDVFGFNEERKSESVICESSKHKNENISLEKSGNCFSVSELGKGLFFDKVEAEVIIDQIKDGKTLPLLEEMKKARNCKEYIFISGENRMQMIENIEMINKAFDVENVLETKECGKHLDQIKNVLVENQPERSGSLNYFCESKHSVTGKQDNEVKGEKETIISKETLVDGCIMRADVEIFPEIQPFATKDSQTKTFNIPPVFCESNIFCTGLPQDSVKEKTEVQFSEELSQSSKTEVKEVESLNMFSTTYIENRLTVESISYEQNEIIEKEISSSFSDVETVLLNHDPMKLSLQHAKEISDELGIVINDDTSNTFYVNENVEIDKELKIDKNEMLIQMNSYCSTVSEVQESIFPEEKSDYYEDVEDSFYSNKNDNPGFESVDMTEGFRLGINKKEVHCNDPRSTKEVVVFDRSLANENIDEEIIDYPNFSEIFEWSGIFKHNDVDFTLFKINLVNVRQKESVKEIDEKSYTIYEKQQNSILPENENKLMDFNVGDYVAREKTLCTLNDINVKDLMFEGREVCDETYKSSWNTLNDTHIFELNGSLKHSNNSHKLTKPVKLEKTLQDGINEWPIIDDSYTDFIMKDLVVHTEHNIDQNDSDQYDCGQNDSLCQWRLRSHAKKKKSFFEPNGDELDSNKKTRKSYYDEEVENIVTSGHDEKNSSTLENKISTFVEECCTNEVIFELPKFEEDNIVTAKENNYDGSVIAKSSSESLNLMSATFNVEESDIQTLDEGQKTKISDDAFHIHKKSGSVDESIDDISLDEYLDSILEKHLGTENKKCPSDSFAVHPQHSNVECQTQLEGLMFSLHTSKCMENLLCSGNEFEICQLNGRKRCLQALNLEETQNKRFKIFDDSIYSDQYKNIYDNNSAVENNNSKPKESDFQELTPTLTENIVGNVKEIIETEPNKDLQLEEQYWEDILDDKLIRRGTIDQKVPDVELQDTHEEKTGRPEKNWINTKHPEAEVGIREVPSNPASTSRSQSVLRLGLSKRAKLPRLHYV